MGKNIVDKSKKSKNKTEEKDKETLFLYVDILGFRDILKNRREIIPKIYEIIDKSFVHEENIKKLDIDIHSFMFSDTFVIYSYEEKLQSLFYIYILVINDIKHRLSDINVYIRAQIRYGEFKYEKLNNITAFYGDVLITAYEEEKNIPDIGLFLDKKIEDLLFSTEEIENKRKTLNIGTGLLDDIYFMDYSDKLYFVFDCAVFNSIAHFFRLTLPPADKPQFDKKYEPVLGLKVELELKYLKNIYSKCFRNDDSGILSPMIRSKYISTFQLYLEKFPDLVKCLIEVDFDLDELLNFLKTAENILIFSTNILPPINQHPPYRKT